MKHIIEITTVSGTGEYSAYRDFAAFKDPASLWSRAITLSLCLDDRMRLIAKSWRGPSKRNVISLFQYVRIISIARDALRYPIISPPAKSVTLIVAMREMGEYTHRQHAPINNEMRAYQNKA